MSDPAALRKELAEHPDVSPEMRVRVLAQTGAIAVGGAVLGTLIGLTVVAATIVLFHRYISLEGGAMALAVALGSAVVGGIAAGSMIVGARRANTRLLRRALRRAEIERSALETRALSATGTSAAVPSHAAEGVTAKLSSPR